MTPMSGTSKGKSLSLGVLWMLLLAATAILRQESALLKFRSIFTVDNDSLTAFPKVILWAWERPEDLTFINPDLVGVAFLAKTITLRGDRVIVRPRLQPLSAAQSVKLMAVTRIESDLVAPPTLTDGQLRETISQIVQLDQIAEIRGIQIDFDARKSERCFYAKLIREVRTRIPKALPLSITALASWCMDDDWIEGLPIDEAVPMLFRMGSDGPLILTRLSDGNDFKPEACRESVGISIDEPALPIFNKKRVYIFASRAWTKSLQAQSFERIGRP